MFYLENKGPGTRHGPFKQTDTRIRLYFLKSSGGKGRYAGSPPADLHSYLTRNGAIQHAISGSRRD